MTGMIPLLPVEENIHCSRSQFLGPSNQLPLADWNFPILSIACGRYPIPVLAADLKCLSTSIHDFIIIPWNTSVDRTAKNVKVQIKISLIFGVLVFVFIIDLRS